MKNNFKALIALAAVSCVTNFSASANANTVTLSVGLGSAYDSLGAVFDNSNAGGQDVAAAADTTEILTLALNGSTGSGPTYERSGNTFSPLPTPTTAGDEEPSGDNFTLPTTEGYTYLVAKYGKNEFVWDIADIIPGTTIDIPSGANSFFGTGAGLSDETLLNPITPTVSVPDGGTSIGLLGLAISGLLAVHRKMN